MTSTPSDNLYIKVIEIIAETMLIPVEEIGSSSTFEELGIDSLGGLSIINELETIFDLQIPNEKALQITNVEQTVACLREAIEDAHG